MADQVLRELEAAAQVILAPPNLVTAEQRQSAEAVFLNFRKTKNPYQLCRQIFETTTMDYVLFESAGVIKAALIREWSMLPQTDIVSLRQYLLHYIISKPTLAPFVRERFLQVIALMIKRGSIDDFGEERKELLNEVEGLIMSGDLPRQLLGCSIISSLIQEYATTAKSSDVGLTWETHVKTKKQFEVTSLQRIFKFCVHALEELTKADIPEAILPLIKSLLAICESILTWNFIITNLPKRLISMFETAYDLDNNATLRITSMWRNVMLNPALVEFFFTIYWKIRSNPQIAHHARTCLVQLASVNAMGYQAKQPYLDNYVQNLLKLLSSIEVIDQEALGIANIFKKIITYFRSNISKLPDDSQRSFMETMTRLTCMFAQGAAQEESMCADDCLYMEAFESMLESWIFVISDETIFPTNFCKQSSVQIFNTYLQCHLSPPDGTRGAGGKELNNEDIDANEEDDRSKFKEQLQTIGHFGRQVPSHALPLISRLLEDRTNKLKDQLNRLVGQPDSLNISGMTSVENLYEDLHWLVLIAGHVLCMESEGETALIPSELICYSMEQAQQGQMDVNVTLQLLASPQSNISDVNGAEQSADHVIRLIAAVFRLCEVAKIAINYNAAQHLSPELCSTVIWFLHRWSMCYLLPRETGYTKISLIFLQAFSDSPVSQWTINFILENVECNMKAFKGEPALIKETVQLLIALVDSPEKAKSLIKSERFGNLVELAKSRNLPQAAKRGLMRVIVSVSTGLSSESGDKNEAAQYFTQIFLPMQNEFKEIICHPDFPRNYHQEEIRARITEIIESLTGVAQGLLMETADLIFQYTCSILNELPRLLSLYHNYQQIVQLILELFGELSNHILLLKKQLNPMLEICFLVVQAYADSTRNRVIADSTAEEDAFQDILLLMKMLTNLLDGNIFEHIPDEGQDAVTPTNVFLYGINIVMPMMTISLLKFPTLCTQYFKMITLLCELHPKKLYTLRPELLQQLLMSVELGLFSFGHEVSILCFDIVQLVSKHIYTETEGQPKNQLMAPFLNLLMNLLMNHQINADLMPHASIPLYHLICCYQEQYQQLVQTLIREQTDPTTAQRLATAFNELTENVALNTERVHKMKFRENFEKFIVNIQGFLIIKYSITKRKTNCL